MGSRSWDPIEPTRRAMRREQRQRERESMTPAQVEVRMRSVIRDRLARDGDQAQLSLDDFKRDNLPMEHVPGLFRRALAAVQSEMAAG